MKWVATNGNAKWVLLACCLCLGARSARAQQFGDLAFGLVRIGSLPAFRGTEPNAGGLVVSGSTGVVVVPHVRVSVDAVGIPFFRTVMVTVMCLMDSRCGHDEVDSFSGIAGASGSVRVDLDPNGRFYARGGAGVFGEFLAKNEAESGLSGGVGTVFRWNQELVGVAEVNLFALLGGSRTRLIPVTVGFRF